MAKTKNFAAVLYAKGEKLVVEERPVPTPEGDEILVLNDAVALNPVDWKRQALGILVPSYPIILGSGKIDTRGVGSTGL